jgi:chromosome segregation ATPase
MPASIETGVDKLVKIVQREKKIEIGAAAKELGVSTAVVQEWADFLEEEGLVETQFSLSKTFLIEKRLSKTEVEKKAKDYDAKKEAFTRKVDATLKQLENETADFESIKKQYYALKDQIGDQIDAVKEEVEQLRHYDELKKTIDQDILKQKVDYQKTLDEVHLRISAEEKRYAKLLEEISSENEKLKAERSEFGDIKREEDDLAKRLDALQEVMKSVSGRIASQSQSVTLHEERLVRMRELAEKLRIELTEKKQKEIDPLIKISHDQEQRIQRIQDEIVSKIKQRRDSMQAYQGEAEEVGKRFETFFNKQMKTETLLKDLEHAKAEMKEELNDLIRKAKAFDLAAKGADTNAHIKELEGKFKEFDEKRSGFATQLEKLKSLIMGKEVQVDVPAPAKTDAQKPAAKPVAKAAKPAAKPAKAAKKKQ